MASTSSLRRPSIWILALLLAAPLATGGAAPNALHNASFEEDDNLDSFPDHWTRQCPTGGLATSSLRASEGSRSVRASLLTGSFCTVYSDPIHVAPGWSYQASVMVQQSSAHTRLEIEWESADRTARAYTSVVETAQTFEWRYVNLYAEAPAGAAIARLRLTVLPGPEGLSDAWWDEARFIVEFVGEQRHGFEGGSLAGWTAGPCAEGSVGASWTPAFAGSWSARVSDTSSSSPCSLVGPPESAPPTTTFTASAWLRGGSGGGTLQIVYHDAWGNLLETHSVTAPASPTAWQRLVLHAKSPPYTAWASLVLHSTASNVGTAYWDEVGLAPGVVPVT